MGDQVAEGLNKATSPIEGVPTDIVGNLIHGRPQERVTSATPGAVTPRAALGGMATSAVNVGFLLAPELGWTRPIVNAGLGAAYDPENRVRGATAGVLFGETLHGATEVTGKILRGKPATETTVVPPTINEVSVPSEVIARPPAADVMPVGKPAPSFDDFNKSVDEIAGDIAPTTAGGNRKTVPGSVSDKYRLDSDQDLLNRAGELVRRQEEYSSGQHGPATWVRDATDLSKPVGGDTGVARRMAQDKGLYDEVKAELQARGWPESDLNDEIDARYRGEKPDVEQPLTPEERRADPTGDRPVWTNEQRVQYIAERQQQFASKINKPWNQWTSDDKAAYFADQATHRAGAPWHPGNEPAQITPPVEAQPAQVSLRSHDENLKVNDAVAKTITANPVVDWLRRQFAPANRGESARSMGDIIRTHGGEMVRNDAVAAASLDTFKKSFDKAPETENLKFYDNMENGRPQETPQLTLAAAKLRDLNDRTTKAVQDLGTGKLEDPIANYMAHIWEDPEKAGAWMAGRAPLEGNKNFLKPRTIPTLREGIEAGLKPVSTNPVELTLRKLHEMNKYIMAQRILADGKDAGLITFNRATEVRPDGHIAIDDPIATVRGPLTDEGAQTIRGSYSAPEPVARVLNNYLSPGLKGDPVFDAYRAASAVVNGTTLGLSAYHAGFTSMETIVSKGAKAVMQLSDRDFQGAVKSMVETPFAPVTNVALGGRGLREYNAPGSVGGQMSEIMDLMARVNGRVSMSDVYKNNSIDKFVAQLRQAPPLDQFGHEGFVQGLKVFRAIPAAIEYAAKPIMEYLVPRQKVGVFADNMGGWLDRNPNATPQEKLRAASTLWDSVDNRLGQVVYDNYFWNAAFKDLAQASIRSVGWNAGTLRELGGGIIDLATSRSRMARGERFMTDKLAYTISLPIMVGLMGGLIHRLNTGKNPETLDDYYHPGTGKTNDQGDQERMNLPSYMKDVFAYKRHPVQTVLNKMNPMIGIVGDMLQNKDFFGNEVRNPDDPIVQQLQQEAKFVAKSLEPYGVSNALEQRQRGQSLGTQAASFVGATPASREDTRSPAENLMSAYINQASPSNASPEEQDTRGVRREIRDLARAGKTASPNVINAVKSGLISRSSVELTARNAMLPPSIVSFKKLTYDQAVKVYQAGNDDEQRLWYPMLTQKYSRYAMEH